MKKFYFLCLTFLFCLSSVDSISQDIWTVKDPAGNEVIIDQDSSFLTVYDDEYLLFYTINPETGKRNILLTNGDTSFWVLNEDAPLSSDFTSFICRKNEELIFRVGNVWYLSYGSAETTEVFYDNNDMDNAYYYIRVFESQTTSNQNDLLIEAVDKITGDTITLLNRYLNDTTVPYSEKLRIYKGNLMGVGTGGEFFICSVFDDVSGEWGEVGFQRQTNSGITMLLPLGVKSDYNVNTIYYFGKQWIINHQENGEKRVYSYRSELDSCIAATETEFPDYTVLDVINPIWDAWGPLFPGNNAYTIEDIVWKGKNQNGSKRYFLRSLFGQEFEIVDLRNDDDVDFVFSQFHDDSIYYYNHSDTQKGLVRTNFVNGMSVKESTSVPFDSDYTLQAYNGKMYFGRYNGQTGTIQAISKDFVNDNKYEFLESSSGERIDNPINFSFLDDRIFIHSRTDDGVKLVVFDPDAVVSVNPVESSSDKLVVSPNPSSGVFKIQMDLEISSSPDHEYIVTNELGSMIMQAKVPSSQFDVDLSGLPAGTYFMTISGRDGIVSSRTLVLANQ